VRALRILYVAKHFFGNPDLVKLSAELAKRNYDINIATSFGSFKRPRPEEDINIFEIGSLITIHKVGYKLSFPFSKIYKAVKGLGVDVIHALSDYSTNTALAAFVSKTLNVPFVYTIQGVSTRLGFRVVDTAMELYDWTIERLIARTARKVILLSKRLMSRARKLDIEEINMEVIPSGIDSDVFNPERPEVKKNAALLRDKLDIGDNIVVGYVGRLIPSKGLTYLLSAVKQIQFKHPNVVLLVVGDGPQRTELEVMAKDAKIRAIFAGWQAETPPFYALMDTFVLPSFFEGLPNVVLEAMAMRKPVVATNVGGNADLVVNGENGFLVPVRDDGQIAFALNKLIENTDMRRRMGQVNRQMVEKIFSWDAVVPRVEKLYHSLSGAG